jgi:sugar lactone lactonase YvrE
MPMNMTVTIEKTSVLPGELVFPESPRWHEGKLWFSDMHTHQVQCVRSDGALETVVNVPQQPSGLGWLPDGRLLVVSMLDRCLLRLDPDGLTMVADLRELAPFHCNDMVVDRHGRAYIGNFGFDYEARHPPKATVLILVTPDGQKRIVAKDLLFPNGSVITPDGRTLIVAETWGARLTGFSIAEDGSLFDRRVWAQFDRVTPDGICLDAEAAIWVASPRGREVLRVREGGNITHRISTENPPLACMLGGADRRTLFILSGPMVSKEEGMALKGGRIETIRVEIPGAGLP